MSNKSSAGKTLISFMVVAYLMDQLGKKKILMIKQFLTIETCFPALAKILRNIQRINVEAIPGLLC